MLNLYVYRNHALLTAAVPVDAGEAPRAGRGATRGQLQHGVVAAHVGEGAQVAVVEGLHGCIQLLVGGRRRQHAVRVEHARQILALLRCHLR